MARGGKGGASRSALQQREDADADKLKEVPVFSFEGIRVHTKLFALYTGLIVLGLIVASVLGAAITSATNFDVSAGETFAQAKTGSNVTFNITVKNTATFSAYAYETHLLGVPPGWTVVTGEDQFGLRAGESKTLPVTVLAAGATPPNRDYALELRVLSKAVDGTTTYSARSVGLTVKLLASSVRVSFDERQANFGLSSGEATRTVAISGCGVPVDLPEISYAPANEFEAANFTIGLTTVGPNQSGWVAVDVGGEGTYELNRTLSVVPQPFLVPREAVAAYVANHTSTAGNQAVPLRLQSCLSNATGWNLSLQDYSQTSFAPLPAGDIRPVNFARNELSTGSSPLIVRVTNDEPRAVNELLSFPDLPAGWDTTPRVQNTSLTVAGAGGHARLEVTVQVAKSAPVGTASINLTSCLDTNKNDCQVSHPQFNVTPTEYFEVKSYLEPATLKTLYVGRSLDTLFIATNKGNQPTSFVPDMPPRLNFAFSFWQGTHTLTPQEPINLDVNQSRLFAMRATVDASQPNAVQAFTASFRGANASVVQQVFMTLNVLAGPSRTPSGPVKVGDNVTVDFLGATESGARLFDTNLISMGPLIDSHQRPVHPEYVPVGIGHAPTPYSFFVQQLANYSGVVHKGFEPYMTGMLVEETIVFWLTPDMTTLSPTATLKDETLVFEVKLSSILA